MRAVKTRDETRNVVIFDLGGDDGIYGPDRSIGIIIPVRLPYTRTKHDLPVFEVAGHK
jgi:hypothetical protein